MSEEVNENQLVPEMDTEAVSQPETTKTLHADPSALSGTPAPSASNPAPVESSPETSRKRKSKDFQHVLPGEDVLSDISTPPGTPPSLRTMLPRFRSSSQTNIRTPPQPRRISSLSISRETSTSNSVLTFRSPSSHPFLSTADVSLNPSLDHQSSTTSLNSAESCSSVFTSPQSHKPLTAYETGEVLSWNGIQHTDETAASPEKLDVPDDKRDSRASSLEVDEGEREESDGRLWDYFVGELTSTDFDESYETKKERVQNFLNVPYELEKFMLFGFLICLDSFLYIFTILPVRIIIAFVAMFRSFFSKSVRLKSAQKCDLIKGALIGICCYFLQPFDASRLYHSVRGQAVIKLYVIFNSLEICDKLCSAFGHDILDSLFSKTTVRTSATPSSSTKTSTHRKHLGRVTHFLVALLYVFAHSMVLFYQVMTLNVSVNSYNNALLTLLLSNQFVEIKGSVFKKFEKENLFQLSCADVVERFQLSVFLFIITIRNYIELTGGTTLSTISTYLTSLSVPSLPHLLHTLQTLDYTDPKTFQILTTLPTKFTSLVTTALGSVEFKLIQVLVMPVVVVYGTEVVVDWLKHAFITKFNGIKPGVYGRFRDSLCRDLAGERRGKEIGTPGGEEGRRRVPFVDQSPVVARRIGFVSIPLSCLMIRVFMQTLHMLGVIEQGGYDGYVESSAPPGVVPAWATAAIPEPPKWVDEARAWGGRWLWEKWCRVLLWMADGNVREWWKGWMWSVAGWGAVVGVVFLCLLLIKIILGKNLLQMSRARVAQLYREHALHHHHQQPEPSLSNPSSQPFPTDTNMKTRPSTEWASEAELERKWKAGGIGRIERPPVIYWDQEKKEKRVDKRKDEVEDEGKKLDSIDRFQMVRSRIV